MMLCSCKFNPLLVSWPYHLTADLQCNRQTGGNTHTQKHTVLTKVLLNRLVKLCLNPPCPAFKLPPSGTNCLYGINPGRMDTQAYIWMSVGFLMTDTQGHLIFTEENRRQQREMGESQRETEGRLETKTRRRQKLRNKSSEKADKFKRECSCPGFFFFFFFY